MDDYGYALMNGIIPASGLLFCVDINITDDDVLEGDQYFLLYLYSDDPGVLLRNNVTFITIIDNDSKILATCHQWLKY